MPSVRRTQRHDIDATNGLTSPFVGGDVDHPLFGLLQDDSLRL